jgi:putative membrane protein
LSEGNTQQASGSTGLGAGADKPADGTARIAEGTGTLHSSAAAVSPTSLMGQSDAATALGPVGVLAWGSVAGCFVLRR